MSKSPMVKRISRFLLAAAVMGALGFGASTLLARDMPYCHGYTETDEECAELCLLYFPENGGYHIWRDSTGCCLCFER